MTKRCKNLLNEENKTKLNSFEVSKKYRNNVIKISNQLRDLVLG